MSTDQTIEQEIRAKGLTAPRITLEDIEAQIASEHFFRPGEAGMDALRFQFLTDDHADPEIRTRVRELVKRLPVMSASAVRQDIDSMMAVPGGTLDPLDTLTFCVLVMRNGFAVVGKSACASPEKFDAEVGRKIARQDAINQCWPLLGYELRSKLAARPADYRDRVRQERAELDEKRMALAAFFGTDRFAGLPGAERQRMRDQLEAMRQYSAVLQERIEAFDCPAEAQWKEANA